MPSARCSNFATGTTARDLPPASEGLRAPAGRMHNAEAERQHKHPVTPGRMSDEKRAEVVEVTLALMDKLSAAEIAAKVDVGGGGRTIRTIIQAARTALQARAEFYVEAHAAATTIAAMQGDAKPAQWALERIAEGEDRVIDKDKADAGSLAPTFNLGFVMGGVPQPVAPAPAPALPSSAAPPEPPAIEGTVV